MPPDASSSPAGRRAAASRAAACEAERGPGVPTAARWARRRGGAPSPPAASPALAPEAVTKVYSEFKDRELWELRRQTGRLMEAAEVLEGTNRVPLLDMPQRP
jgi:hypothetical protein